MKNIKNLNKFIVAASIVASLSVVYSSEQLEQALKLRETRGQMRTQTVEVKKADAELIEAKAEKEKREAEENEMRKRIGEEESADHNELMGLIDLYNNTKGSDLKNAFYFDKIQEKYIEILSKKIQRGECSGMKEDLKVLEANLQKGRQLWKEQVARELAAEKLEAEKLAAEKLAAEKLAAEKKAVAEKLAAEKLAAEKLAAEKLAAEKLAAEKLAEDKLAAEKLAAEKLAEDKLAAEKLEAEKLAAEKLAAEKLAAEKLAAEKLAAEKLAAEKNLYYYKYMPKFVIRIQYFDDISEVKNSLIVSKLIKDMIKYEINNISRIRNSGVGSLLELENNFLTEYEKYELKQISENLQNLKMFRKNLKLNLKILKGETNIPPSL